MWRWSNFYIDKIFFLSIRAQLVKKTRILCIHLYINAIIYLGSSLFDMGRRKEQMFFMFVQSFTNGQIMGFGC